MKISFLVIVLFVFYLSISIALLTACAFQKRSRPQLDTVTGVYTPKRYRQLRVKDFPKVPSWRLEWYSNPPPSALKALTPATCHGATTSHNVIVGVGSLCYSLYRPIFLYTKALYSSLLRFFQVLSLK